MAGAVHNMPPRELDEALSLYSALMHTVVAAPGGRNDPDALEHVTNLCRRSVAAVNDLEARVMIRSIEHMARLLFYADGHVGMEAGPLRGVDALKFQIFNAVSYTHLTLPTSDLV